MSKVIVVTGSTGQQGGSVARTMLKTGDWRVRGITRNSNNEAATKLKHLGAEVVQADYDNEQSLVDAFKVRLNQTSPALRFTDVARY